jgi:hypothetical protein
MYYTVLVVIMQWVICEIKSGGLRHQQKLKEETFPPKLKGEKSRCAAVQARRKRQDGYF